MDNDCGCHGEDVDRDDCRFPAVVAENESLKTERLEIQRALCAEFASPNKDDAEPYTLEEFKGGIRCLGFEREDFLQQLVKARQERDALAGEIRRLTMEVRVLAARLEVSREAVEQFLANERKSVQETQ